MIELFDLLKERKLTISFAESITGGKLASTLTSISGSSQVFKGSIVSYSNIIKKDLLKVKEETINNYSIVSEKVASEMVLGLSNLINSNIYISTTGNAGPTMQNNTNKLNAYYSIMYLNEIKTYEYVFNSNDRINNIDSLINDILIKVKELIKAH